MRFRVRRDDALTAAVWLVTCVLLFVACLRLGASVADALWFVVPAGVVSFACRTAVYSWSRRRAERRRSASGRA